MPLFDLRHGTQAQWNELGQMRMNLKNPRDQEGTLGGGHFAHVHRIDDIEIELLDDIDRSAERLFKNAEGGAPGQRITITEMSTQRLDGRGHVQH